MIAELGGPFSVAGRGGKFCRRGWLDGTSDLVFASHSGLLGGGWTGDGVAARVMALLAGSVPGRPGSWDSRSPGWHGPQATRARGSSSQGWFQFCVVRLTVGAGAAGPSRFGGFRPAYFRAWVMMAARSTDSIWPRLNPRSSIAVAAVRASSRSASDAAEIR